MQAMNCNESKDALPINFYQFYQFINPSKQMHNLQDYIRKEINNLINPPQSSKATIKSFSVKNIKKTQFSPKDDNIYWKTYSRSKKQLIDHPNSKQTINKSKSTFYRDLLKAQYTLNLKSVPHRASSSSTRNRNDTQVTSSTHRRPIIDSHTGRRTKIAQLADLNLIKRQSSTGSDNYLKAKLGFSHNRPPSASSLFKIIKICNMQSK